ncbi:hypothetical protein PI124_g19644 [Phytophthora idaei]|nr:hypothetical protein PI125_g1998 [Phytophthora idaei]KAG3235324.1 hypothetical protein PI124_g19644 [Phytophthora idaei]
MSYGTKLQLFTAIANRKLQVAQDKDAGQRDKGVDRVAILRESASQMSLVIQTQKVCRVDKAKPTPYLS